MDDDLTSPQAGFLQTYGLYLMNGGTPEGFMELNEDDIQTMYTSYMAMQFSSERRILKGLGKMMGAIDGRS